MNYPDLPVYLAAVQRADEGMLLILLMVGAAVVFYLLTRRRRMGIRLAPVVMFYLTLLMVVVSWRG